MREDDVSDILGLEARGESAAAIDAVDRALALRQALADAAIDEDDVVTIDRQRTVEAHRDAVLVIRADLLSPKRLRHDAEHRAAVHREEAVVQQMNADAADGDHEATVP